MSEDVVIVGGGPNGLLLGCELALSGLRPIVLEQLPERATEPKANGLVGRVLAALDSRGLYQRISGSDRPPAPVPYFPFGGLLLDMSTMDDSALCAHGIPQARLEELLEQRAAELGVRVRRGHRVTGLTQDADAVRIAVSGPDGEYACEARFLVGADGGGSAVRKLAGIGFPGITENCLSRRGGLVSVPEPVAVPATGELDVPGLGRLSQATFHRTDNGLFSHLMVRPGVFRVAVTEWTELLDEEVDTAITVDELAAAIARVLGAAVPIGEVPDAGRVRSARRGNSRLADRYRQGRIFLVGDAAHVFAGYGGPGLNLGMQDVLNLGWKLAAELHGWAPDGLLDSYQDERQPVGRRVVMHSRAQTALLSPGPYITAMRELFTELLDDQRNVRRIADLMAGADVRYDMRPDGPAHPLVGDWMPDLAVRTATGPSRVAVLLRTGRPLLLVLADRPDLVAAAGGWTDRVDVVTASSPDRPLDAVLVRPDGFVAWAAGPDPADGADGLTHALRTWFGPARH